MPEPGSTIIHETYKLARHIKVLEDFITSAYNARDDHELGSIVYDAHCYLEEIREEEERTG